MSLVREALSWWVAQLRGLLPARVLEKDLYGDALIADLQPDGESIAWMQRRGRREARIADPSRAKALLSNRTPGRCLLRLPRGAVLERSLALPLATEPELDRVIAYEVDRISPFSGTEVAWTYAVVQRDRAAGRLLVRVALVPLAKMQPVLDRLRRLGATPASVLGPRDGGGWWSISLLPAGRTEGSPGLRRLALSLAVCCAVLAFAAVVLPFALQEQALREAEARIERERPSVAEADALRRRVVERAGGGNALAAEAARIGGMLDIIATLTTLLPDDAHLTSLTIRQRVVAMTGRTPSAARLIPLLTSDLTIRNAAFAAPVTRIGGTREDQFSIRAEFGS